MWFRYEKACGGGNNFEAWKVVSLEVYFLVFFLCFNSRQMHFWATVLRLSIIISIGEVNDIFCEVHDFFFQKWWFDN